MNNLIVVFLAMLACVCFYFIRDQKKVSKTAIWTLYAALLAVAFYLFLSKVIHIIQYPQVWDFTAFYLWGKAAAGGHDFYQPENLHLVYNSIHLPSLNYDDFVKEIVNVGFLYPPPTILYFYPLGFLPYHTALISWTIFNLIFLFGSIYLVYNLFFKAYKLNGLILVTILVLIFSPVKATIIYSQTNFILLFLSLLMKKYADKEISGVFLAVAFFTKPYMIIIGLFFLLRMKWKTILYFIISTLVIIGVTFVLFGKEPFSSYIFNSPSHRIPGPVFSEDVNQSLHAVLLRNHLISLDTPATFMYIAAGVFLVTVGYLFYLLRRKRYDYMWAVLLLVALLIYPGTLSHYGVLLLFIVFQFFDEKRELGINGYLNILLIGLFYWLIAFSVFAAICFLLIIIILKSVRPRVFNRVSTF